MPCLSQDDPALSTKDLLSWSLDDPQYDTSKPLWIDADDPSRSISGDEARTLIKKLVAGFRYAGLKPGDAVCIASYSEIYYSILVLGIIAAGCVFTGTNPSYTPLELEHHLRASRAQMVICEPELLPPILATSVGSDLLSLHNITPPNPRLRPPHSPLHAPHDPPFPQRPP
ncbi:AMP-dependent synthetase/ligase [Macrophomina phaseolina MS6]|uniref:AMP-dependent synthetase/ligase n=1 Tax=Macrophomina phaseolina (strain MS6) TaxID=1126212 RepID=K2RN64_MACPH|nr:AMP-dependent synthetase/ligase [Macrophomina phaseolina MS6]